MHFIFTRKPHKPPQRKKDGVLAPDLQDADAVFTTRRGYWLYGFMFNDDVAAGFTKCTLAVASADTLPVTLAAQPLSSSINNMPTNPNKTKTKKEISRAAADGVMVGEPLSGAERVSSDAVGK
jgi:fermentation-respiration switch protein FrsA (DUF1100 family)